ncbi:MAG: trypsin-like peptidase domain-containing protein [Clostridia bacterium]|nr:trypsin-like peptidase domain-containing protein [Clostridia bacterium]
MKRKGLYFKRALVLLLVLIIPLSLASCFSYGDLLDHYGITTGTPESGGEPSGTDGASGAETTAGDSDPSDETREPGDQIQNNVTIQTNGTGDAKYAAAAGLRSAVSVYATFTTTGFWGNESTGTSAGSGVIYKLDVETGSAFIITNYHVVYNNAANTSNGISNDIKVFLYGMEGSVYAIPATYVGGSMNYDIAVLHVENDRTLKDAAQRGAAAQIKLADSDLVAVGQTAIAIGNPESAGISVTTGIVSVDSEHITMTASDGRSQVSFRVIRIDTAVNSGNSGGGLFNANGELIGIVNAKVTSSDVENIGYAIPSNVARGIADNIIDYCFGKECKTVMRGLLGITVETSALNTSYDAETGLLHKYEQVRVVEVTTGGLGEKILKSGDIISAIRIGDKTVEITRQYHLIDAMLDVRVGDAVSLTILRDGKTETVSTTITEDCLAAY